MMMMMIILLIIHLLFDGVFRRCLLLRLEKENKNIKLFC
jgi:hypothetical protein